MGAHRKEVTHYNTLSYNKIEIGDRVCVDGSKGLFEVHRKGKYTLHVAPLTDEGQPVLTTDWLGKSTHQTRLVNASNVFIKGEEDAT